MGPLIWPTLAYVGVMDRSSPLTILPSLLDGVSTFRPIPSLFSDNCIMQGTATHSIPQLSLRLELDDPFTIKEMIKTIAHLQFHKAGVHGIQPVWLSDAPCQASQSSSLLLEAGTLTQDFCNVIIIALCKDMGEKSECSHFQGITLHSIVGKVLARVLFNRLVATIAEENLQRSSVASEPTEAQLTWYSSFVNSRKSARTKTRHSVLLLLTSLKL